MLMGLVARRGRGRLPSTDPRRTRVWRPHSHSHPKVLTIITATLSICPARAAVHPCSLFFLPYLTYSTLPQLPSTSSPPTFPRAYKALPPVTNTHRRAGQSRTARWRAIRFRRVSPGSSLPGPSPHAPTARPPRRVATHERIGKPASVPVSASSARSRRRFSPGRGGLVGCHRRSTHIAASVLRLAPLEDCIS